LLSSPAAAASFALSRPALSSPSSAPLAAGLSAPSAPDAAPSAPARAVFTASFVSSDGVSPRMLDALATARQIPNKSTIDNYMFIDVD